MRYAANCVHILVVYIFLHCFVLFYFVISYLSYICWQFYFFCSLSFAIRHFCLRQQSAATAAATQQQQNLLLFCILLLFLIAASTALKKNKEIILWHVLSCSLFYSLRPLHHRHHWGRLASTMQHAAWIFFIILLKYLKSKQTSLDYFHCKNQLQLPFEACCTYTLLKLLFWWKMPAHEFVTLICEKKGVSFLFDIPSFCPKKTCWACRK